MIDQDKERAEFEASYKNKHSMATTIRLASGRYYSTLVESAWQGWLASAERSAKRIAELEDVADKLYQSLQEVLQMQVNGHDLQDRMQFSMPGRAIGGKAYAARKLYEAMKGGA